MTDDDVFDRVREKDHTILTCIRDNHDNTRRIRDATTLSRREVAHSLDKLEELGLIETWTPDGRVTEVIDGQKRNFQAPRHAALTDHGHAYLDWTDREDTRYSDMTHDELVEKVHQLEQEVDALQDAFEAFRRQVRRKLE